MDSFDNINEYKIFPNTFPDIKHQLLALHIANGENKNASEVIAQLLLTPEDEVRKILTTLNQQHGNTPLTLCLAKNYKKYNSSSQEVSLSTMQLTEDLLKLAKEKNCLDDILLQKTNSKPEDEHPLQLTPMNIAFLHRDLNLVKLLIKYGAKIDPTSLDLMDQSCEYCRTAIGRITYNLTEKGIKIVQSMSSDDPRKQNVISNWNCFYEREPEQSMSDARNIHQNEWEARNKKFPGEVKNLLGKKSALGQSFVEKYNTQKEGSKCCQIF